MNGDYDKTLTDMHRQYCGILYMNWAIEPHFYQPFIAISLSPITIYILLSLACKYVSYRVKMVINSNSFILINKTSNYLRDHPASSVYRLLMNDTSSS